MNQAEVRSKAAIQTEMDKCSNNIAEYEAVLLGIHKL
jgi:ribonuclease HI